MTIAAAALLLFLILDPLGNIPILLSLFKDLPAARQRKVLLRELLIALVVLMLFLWGGQYALELMHLRQESVSIAGGIVLFLIGLRMIFPPPDGVMGEMPGGEPFIVLHGGLKDWFDAQHLMAHITVTDESEYAASFCVVEKTARDFK